MSTLHLTLDHEIFAGRSGRGVRVAVVDSGIAAGHPHVGVVTASVRIGASVTSAVASGSVADGDAVLAGPSGLRAHATDVLDRLGHGTAVAAAIREKAPGVDLISVKVFDRALTTTADALALGITWAAEQNVRLINLSLGTQNPDREEVLRSAVSYAAQRGALVVSASESAGVKWLPGSLAGVAGVLEDWECERSALAVDVGPNGQERFRASAYPRPIPGVPRERNVSGVSFAVANVTGFLARLCEADATIRTLADFGRLLMR